MTSQKASSRGTRLIALMPAYNESNAIMGVLEKVAAYVDALVIVDDCSKDDTVALIEAWRKQHPGVYLIALSKNVGASGALKVGYVFVQHLLEQGAIAENDLVLEMDSDGQHDPKFIPSLLQVLEDARVDVVQARRDFSVYPLYKRFGNRFLSMIASILGGFRYHDVESNFRISRVYVFPRLLEYFSGYRYSGAFEVGIILASLGFRINNAVLVQVPFYREGARASDGFHVLAMGLRAWLKVRLKTKNSSYSMLTQEALAHLIES